ncbi:receptor-like protein kinase [Gossypium australe]|uniref:Receptor-like protein kinase n=1 Tax=Gossypium australe TaxID=47621 RepID=A0A5B6WJ46_9ROSI|nr:receptor-like protein kinase [Gossypium australe]
MSMLRKYHADPSHIEPVEVIAREEKVLRNKGISLVKVLWRNHKTIKVTWETKESIKHQYPHLF